MQIKKLLTFLKELVKVFRSLINVLICVKHLLTLIEENYMPVTNITFK